MKYTANSLHTFNNSKNFDEETLNHILNSSPLYSQQFAIPNEEFERLKNKFIFYKKTNSFNPDIIILKKKSNLYKKINISDLNYCNMFIGDYFSLYINMNKLSICNKATDNSPIMRGHSWTISIKYSCYANFNLKFLFIIKT